MRPHPSSLRRRRRHHQRVNSQYNLCSRSIRRVVVAADVDAAAVLQMGVIGDAAPRHHPFLYQTRGRTQDGRGNERLQIAFIGRI